MKLSRQPVRSCAIPCGRVLVVQSVTDVPEVRGGGRISIAKVLDPEAPVRPRPGELPVTSPAGMVARIYSRLVEENEIAIEAALVLAEDRGFDAIHELLG